ncbi:MAG: hypothetical protein U1F40_00940 [Turneriella sp.]
MKKNLKNSGVRRSRPAASPMKAYSIVKDRSSKPLFVLVPYEVWQETKKANRAKSAKQKPKHRRKKTEKVPPWADLAGVLGEREDALEYQKRLRGEWS